MSTLFSAYGKSGAISVFPLHSLPPLHAPPQNTPSAHGDTSAKTGGNAGPGQAPKGNAEGGFDTPQPSQKERSLRRPQQTTTQPGRLPADNVAPCNGDMSGGSM